MRRALVLLAALALASCGQPMWRDTLLVGQPGLAPDNLPAFFDCLREKHQTVVAAHRGGPEPGYAENAIPTFEHTLTLAPALMEIDITRTRDGVLVLMHDDDVARTTNGEGLVRDLTAAQFQALSLKDETGRVLDAHPPTLREALDWAEGKAILELDVKRSVSYEDVVAEVRAAEAQNRVIFIAYSTAAASRIHELAPELMISASIENEADLEALRREGVDLTKVLAWTGITEPNSALNVALAQTGVEAMFGTLGGRDSWDERFERSDDDQYAEFAETGLQLISTDRVGAAAADLDAADGANGYGALQCVRAS